MTDSGRDGAERDALRATEGRFRVLFEHSPISIWEEDFSEVRRTFEELRGAGVGDLEAHLRVHPEVVQRCAGAVRIVDVNRAAVTLHRAPSKEALLAGLLETFTPESFETFRKELLALWEGKTELVSDAVVRTLDGERRDVTVHFAVSPGHEGTLSRVLVSLVDVTDRRRAEEALRESEARYRTLFEESFDGLFVTSPAGKIVDMNRKGVAILGYDTKEEVLRLDLQRDVYAHPKDRQRILEMVERSGTAEYDVPVKRKDGTRIVARCSLTAVRGRAGAIDSYRGIIRDVTEQRRSEAATRESDRRYREVFDNVSDSIFVIDVTAEGRFRFDAVNPAAERISGLRNADLQGRWLEDGVRPEVVSHVLPHWRRCVETAAPVQYVDEYTRVADGRRLYLHSTLVPVRGAGGEVARLLVVSRDVTEQKNADDAIRQAELRYRQVFENASDVIYLLEVTEDGRFRNLDVNPAFERSVGLTAAQVLGKCQEETVPPETARIVNAKYRGCVEAGKAVQEEVVLDLPVGRKTFRSTLIPIRDGQGRVYRIVGLSRDVTDQVRAEAEIRELNQDLERRVNERTAQLQAAKDELEAFAYSVSHDLRAPLRHVDGFVALLKLHAAGGLDERALHDLAAIEASAKRMGALIDDLLSFSRMGRCEMAAQEVDLGVLVAEVIREAMVEAPGRAVRFEVAELPRVTGDRAMLRVVLVNLLSNALKFTRTRPRRRSRSAHGGIPRARRWSPSATTASGST